MGQKTILLIEDNALNMKLFNSILQIGRYRILNVTTGESGIQIARKHRPDLILMDYSTSRFGRTHGDPHHQGRPGINRPLQRHPAHRQLCRDQSRSLPRVFHLYRYLSEESNYDEGKIAFSDQ